MKTNKGKLRSRLLKSPTDGKRLVGRLGEDLGVWVVLSSLKLSVKYLQSNIQFIQDLHNLKVRPQVITKLL